MKKINIILSLVAILAACLPGSPVCAGNNCTNEEKPFFSQPRTPGENEYRFTTEYLTYKADGSLVSRESTSLEVTIEVDSKGMQHLTCQRFSISDAEGNVSEIPQLTGYENEYNSSSEQVLGVNHADFIGIKTEEGTTLSPELEYRIYNTFIDFYAFNNVFAQADLTADGNTIADLDKVGQKIEHYSAYSDPPVDLADSVKKGSYFRNGRVTLEWKGSSVVSGAACALVEFDSGESSFEMFMEPTPKMDLHVKGGSQYWGDLYINSENLWLERATFKELVISEMKMDGNLASSSIIKRIGVIEKID